MTLCAGWGKSKLLDLPENPNFKEIQTLCRYADKYGIVQKKSLDFFLFMLQSFMIELEVIK